MILKFTTGGTTPIKQEQGTWLTVPTTAVLGTFLPLKPNDLQKVAKKFDNHWIELQDKHLNKWTTEGKYEYLL